MTFPIPDDILANHIAVLGETGAGKTYDTKSVIEHLAGENYRICILDTIKSDWWGITSSANGKRPGLPFKILGGPRGHVPLHSGAGRVIGRLVGEGKLPLSIVDMADFEPGGVSRFFEEFAAALWKHMRGVIYLVMEEAHEIAPKERSGFTKENMAVHWAKKLATGSRTKGIRLVIASQRTQSVHNALLGSCKTMMAHSLSLPADQKPVLDWLNANVLDKTLRSQIASDLAFLPRGTAWVCSAKAGFFEKIAFPLIATFDNSKTPEKDAEDFDVATAPVDATELRAIIGEAVQEAEANDPTALKAEIAKLKREIATKAPAKIDKAVDQAALAAAEQRGYERGRSDGIDIGHAAAFDQLREWMAQTAPTATLSNRPRIIPQNIPKPGQPGQKPAIAPVRVPESARKPAGGTGPVGDLDGPTRRILEALTFWERVGFIAPTRSQVAPMAGYSPRSSGFDKALSLARTAGLIDYPWSGTVSRTEAGRALVVEPSLTSVRNAIGPVIGAAFSRVLDAIPTSGSIARGDLAEASGYSGKSSGFDKALSSLKTLGLITYPASGFVAVEPWVWS